VATAVGERQCGEAHAGSHRHRVKAPEQDFVVVGHDPAMDAAEELAKQLDA